MKTIVLYHSADFDGILSREVCRSWLTSKHDEVDYIGWDYGQPVPDVGAYSLIYMVDICIDALMTQENRTRLIWIDHHKTAIEKHGVAWTGVRLDGVAACRLCWHWFSEYLDHCTLWVCGSLDPRFPSLEDFKARRVNEPPLVRLAGEYDVWDKRDPSADVLQYGLRSIPIESREAELSFYFEMWREGRVESCEDLLVVLLDRGSIAKVYGEELDRATSRRSHPLQWRGLRWRVINTAVGNSKTFGAEVGPGIDALMMWRWDGLRATVSLYGCAHRPDLDLSTIARELGGGGHRQACGFQLGSLELMQRVLEGDDLKDPTQAN